VVQCTVDAEVSFALPAATLYMYICIVTTPLRYELAKAEQRRKDDEEARRRGSLANTGRRVSAIGMLGLGLRSLQQSTTRAIEIASRSRSRLRSFRLLAKKALWKQRKQALSRRNSMWWGIEAHLRVANNRAFFEDMNKIQEFEKSPLFQREDYLQKFVSKIPARAIFPVARGQHSAADDVDGIIGDGAEESSLPPFMIHPHSSFKSAWDVLTLLLLVCEPKS
jgi:hypothetical protein